MKVTIIHGKSGDPEVHKAGCAHLRQAYARHSDLNYTMEAATAIDVALDFWTDIIAERMMEDGFRVSSLLRARREAANLIGDMGWKPCTSALPTGDVDPDHHEYAPMPGLSSEPEACSVCGDSEGANDHLDADDAAHVWMDVEGLTAFDIEDADYIVSQVKGHFDDDEMAAARMVSDWIGGSSTPESALDGGSAEAIAGFLRFVEDVEADRADNLNLSPEALAEAARNTTAEAPEPMTMDEFMAKMLSVFPLARVEADTAGELVINTGLQYLASDVILPFAD